ncbi:hypothetical protein ABEF95_016579 [Exophiala dermatitidis]
MARPKFNILEDPPHPRTEPTSSNGSGQQQDLNPGGIRTLPALDVINADMPAEMPKKVWGGREQAGQIVHG